LLADAPGHDDVAARNQLVRVLYEWTARLGIPPLSHYGVTNGDVARIVAGSRGSSMKTNPLVLTDAEIAGVVHARL
jgi:alcohol dehydrogenase